LDPVADVAFAPAQVAGALLQLPVESVELIAGSGRNSRIYRIRAGGKALCLKRYVAKSNDSRDRLRTEMDALELMVKHGIAHVPRPLARDAAQDCALMSWVEGVPVDAVGETDIDAALRFLSNIHALSRVEEAQHQPLGSEACLSGAEIVAQLANRLRRLGTAAEDDAALAVFLERLSRFLFASVLPQVIEGYRSLKLAFSAALPFALRSLCPSDFGFHNALRSAEGLVFLDFDYFGWDDPVKLVSDFVLHPGMRLPEGLKRRFILGAQQIYGADNTFAPRLNLLFALFALRWCLILLNEFLPERWATRLHAGIQDDWASVKRVQLDRAVKLFELSETTFPRFPHDA
jgi:hypothetical protein